MSEFMKRNKDRNNKILSTKEDNRPKKNRTIEEKKQSFVESIKVSNIQQENQDIEQNIGENIEPNIEESMEEYVNYCISNKKAQQYAERRDAEKIENERKIKLLDTIKNLKNNKEQEDPEMEEFFREIKAKADKCMKEQDEEKQKEILEKAQERKRLQMARYEQIQKKQQNKLKRHRTILSGGFLGEILDSEEFSNMLKQQDEEETR